MGHWILHDKLDIFHAPLFLFVCNFFIYMWLKLHRHNICMLLWKMNGHKIYEDDGRMTVTLPSLISLLCKGDLLPGVGLTLKLITFQVDYLPELSLEIPWITHIKLDITKNFSNICVSELHVSYSFCFQPHHCSTETLCAHISSHNFFGYQTFSGSTSLNVRIFHVQDTHQYHTSHAKVLHKT